MTSDIFGNVHKAIRHALFSACHALGRCGDDAAQQAEARRLLGEALHFVAHHGDNEDTLLLPLLAAPLPEVHARLTAEHATLDRAIAALRERMDDHAPTLYLDACALTGRYLAHMDLEERELAPLIASQLSVDALRGFSAASIARTAPADQELMLGHTLRAIPEPDAAALLARLPPALASRLTGSTSKQDRTA